MSNQNGAKLKDQNISTLGNTENPPQKMSFCFLANVTKSFKNLIRNHQIIIVPKMDLIINATEIFDIFPPMIMNYCGIWAMQFQLFLAKFHEQN